MIFVSRRRRGPGRFLNAKVHLFFAGAAVLLLGMALERDVLVAFAVAILAAGFALRFFERDDEPPGAGAEDENGGAEDPADTPRAKSPPDGPPGGRD